MLARFTTQYDCFGLQLRSDLALPELRPGDDGADPDVDVHFGRVAASLPDCSARGVCYEAAPRAALISLPGIGRFLAEDGARVTIDPAPDVDDSTLRLFLLGVCMGVLLHQRGCFVLHAAAVERNGVCIALAGPSSIGKSTLAAAFTRREYTLVTDEVCAVDLCAGKPFVRPAYPGLLLWRDALNKLGLFSDSLPRVRPELEKHVFQVPSRFAEQPVPMQRMYALTTHNRDDVVLEHLKGFDRFRALLDNTYREPYLEGLGLARQRQRICAAIAPCVSVSRLTWPQRWDDIEEAIELIEADHEDAAPTKIDITDSQPVQAYG